MTSPNMLAGYMDGVCVGGDVEAPLFRELVASQI